MNSLDRHRRHGFAAVVLWALLAACAGFADPVPGTYPAGATSVAPVQSPRVGVGSTQSPAPGTASPRGATPSTRGTPPSPSVGNDGRLILAAQDAEQIAVVMDLLRAYNAADLATVLALVSDEIAWADCRYDASGGQPTGVRGKSALTVWLQQRFAEHDRLELDQLTIRNGVIAVSYRRRMSETIRQAGFPDGIVPNLATKVLFDYRGGTMTAAGSAQRYRIGVFANASFGTAGDTVCRLVPAH